VRDYLLFPAEAGPTHRVVQLSSMLGAALAAKLVACFRI